jgi:hypothetical protein
LQNTPFTFGPIALTNTYTTNILNPPTTTGGVNAGNPNAYIILTHVKIVEKAGTGATVRLYKGATGANAAGTEVMFGLNQAVASANYIEWWGRLKFKVADFLVGGASAATTLTIEGEGEMGVEF